MIVVFDLLKIFSKLSRAATRDYPRNCDLTSLSAAFASSVVMSSGVAVAQTASVSQSNEVTVIIDGVTHSYLQPAVTVGGRTLVPLRGVFEALQAEVSWDYATRTATGTKGDIEVVVQVDNKTAYVNNKYVAV